MTELARCPCGKVPTDIIIRETVEFDGCANYRDVSGTCCGEWSIRAVVDDEGDFATAKIACIEAWNSAPRGRAE